LTARPPEAVGETCGVGVIEFESVGKTFRDGTAAVVDLNLTVPSGKITVIVGPSGCGKTTTLRMVNRMLEPTSGSITWDGVPLRSKRKTTLRRQMGYVIQSGGLFPHRTVLDNIATVPSLLHWPKKKIQKRSLEVLDSVGLQRNLAHRYPAQLSGGQQQRVGVARALAADPLVLLMDEPFSAVDPVVRSELQEFFRGLQRELSKTIILITHDIDEAIKLGDQVAIMRTGGHLAQVGTPQQLLDEPTDAFVEGFIGRDRGFRSLSFQPASELPLQRVKVVRDVETAAGAGPILVVDGDARPVGWADPERPGRVFPLGSTFSPETDSLRVALDSALTSPHGLAVGVTADTQRYAGVVSADTILDRVRDVRVSIAESISIREAEAAPEYEPLDEPEHEYESVGQAEPEYAPVSEAEPENEPVGEPEPDNEPAEDPEHASTAEAEQQSAPAQVYEPKDVDSGSTSESVESVYNWEDERADAYGWEEPAQSPEPEEEPAQSHETTPRPGPESSTDAGPDESNADHSQAAAQTSADIESPENGDPTIAIESPESDSPESDTGQQPGPTPTFRAQRRVDTHQEDWEAMGKALYRRGSGILQ
jgi:osmoprotectant transport system ATP-binding protein